MQSTKWVGDRSEYVMAYQCNYPNCDGATTLIETEDRDFSVVVEKYECEYGHTFHENLEAQ